jgi:hypothetical protein
MYKDMNDKKLGFYVRSFVDNQIIDRLKVDIQIVDAKSRPYVLINLP